MSTVHGDVVKEGRHNELNECPQESKDETWFLHPSGVTCRKEENVL